jgi:dihydrofolate synthase / folylpolyglutamate synthase
MDFAESVGLMQGLLRFGEKYGNDRFEALLSRLGDPHRQFDALHIAGTKGKGSTTTFAASVLRAAGYRTGSYLSPYVYDLRERIQINGEMISKDDFARWVTIIRPHMEALNGTEFGQTTEFELKTAVAFCYFAEQKVDYAVLEVGLGGRLDATNVIPMPLVSVITNIGYDHIEILGNTLEEIAGEKAGIIKPGGVCVTGIEGGPALTTVQDVCQKLGATLVCVVPGQQWRTEPDDSLSMQTPRRKLSGLNLRMRGRFQHANAAVALMAIDVAGVSGVSDMAAREGLEQAFAPGRMEVVRKENPTVILDAAHNELAAEVLSDSLVKDFRANDHPLIIVVGLSRRHEPADLLRSLKGLRPMMLIATEPSFRPRPISDLVESAIALGFSNVKAADSVPAALTIAIRASRDFEKPLVLVTGSFFTVGDLPPDIRDSLFDAV